MKINMNAFCAIVVFSFVGLCLNLEADEDRYLHSTLIIDEIPGRIVGNDNDPPGRITHFDQDGKLLFETNSFKMPYDAALTKDGNYLLALIRENAIWKVSKNLEVLKVIQVGGYPTGLHLLPNGNLLVSGWHDETPGFVKEFNQKGELVWEVKALKWPWKAERLENGNTLIADAGTNRIFEVNADGREVWEISNLGPDKNELFNGLGPVYVQRLENGNNLVSIRALNKIQELDRAGNLIWEIDGDIVKAPYSAVRLKNGNTLIADGGHFRVIEVDMNKNIVWEKGGIGYAAKAYRFE